MTNKQRKVVILLSPFIIWVLFHNRFEELSTDLFVNPILSYCKSEIINDIIIGLFIVGVLYYYSVKLRVGYINSKKRVLFISTILIFYIYYGNMSEVWVFTPSSISESIKYFDIIFLVVLGEWTLLLAPYFKDKPKPINALALVSDDPIKSSESDKLGRTELAKDLANRLIHTTGDQAIAIGITGEWGSGKTSFLALLESQLDENTIVIQFNPWQSLNNEAVIKNFFETLNLKLSVYSARLPKQISAYSKQLLAIKDTAFTRILRNGIVKFEGEDLNDRYDQINDTLDKLNKQVVVFIDDVDRLDKKEVVELLKLIRNTGSFKNVKFIVAFDREYVLNAVSSINSHNYRIYLDKIFLQLIELTPVKFTSLQHILKDELISRFEGQKDEIEKTLGIRSFNSDHLIKDVITNLRDVKRFLNYFVVDYYWMNGEVNFDDFIKIKLLKYKFPGVYRQLYLNRSQFISIDNMQDSILKKESNSHSSKTIIEIDMEVSAELYGLNSTAISTVMQLLNSIFGYNKFGKNEHLSIRKGQHFHKYFLGRIKDSDLSENEFKESLLLPLDQLKIKIDEWIVDGKRTLLIERLKKVRVEDQSTRGQFEKMILSIFHFGSVERLEQGWGFMQFGYDNDDLYYKLNDSKNFITNKFYKSNRKEYRKFLLDIFESAKLPFRMHLNFGEWILKWGYDGLPIKLEEFEQFQVKYFEIYLNSIEGFQKDNLIWDFYRGCILANGKTKNKRREKIPKANELLISFILDSDLDGFILAIITNENRHSEGFSISTIIQDIFGDYESFYLFMESQTDDESRYLTEFIKFLRQLKESNFKEYVPFEFKVIPIKEKFNI